MRVRRLNPVERLDSLRREVSRWAAGRRSPFGVGWTGHGEERAIRLPLDGYVTAEEIVIRAAVPGLGPEDVEVTVQGNTLTIEGRFLGPLASVDYLFQERVSGPFRREVTINVPVRADQAQARFDKGMLTVILPKRGDARPKAVEIDSAHSA
jgi:HSP20 family protein